MKKEQETTTRTTRVLDRLSLVEIVTNKGDNEADVKYNLILNHGGSRRLDQLGLVDKTDLLRIHKLITETLFTKKEWEALKERESRG